MKAMDYNMVTRLVLATSLLLAILPFSGTAQATMPEAITLGSDGDPNDYGAKWTSLILGEAFKRLGIPLQIKNYPMARRTAMEDAGGLDGDVGRAITFGAAHPNLVRVEEPWSEMYFALYTANPGLKLQNLDELKSSNLIVDYRRGILLCENKLKSLALSRLGEVSNEQSGINKLLAGRSDIYCDLEWVVRQQLNTPEFKDAMLPRKLLSLGSLSIHTYLHKKHSTLAPKLSAVLKQMKNEKLLEKYRLQVEHELGWIR